MDGVVGAGHPAGFLALHPGPAHQHILNGIVEHVAHVQHARYVGRRNHDRVGLLAGVGLGFEKALLLPALVPFGFYVGRGIGFGDGHRGEIREADTGTKVAISGRGRK